jgi:L-fuconolactonase
MIDAHQHFWQIGAHGCTWPTPDLTCIHRDFGPAELASHSAAAGVGATVLVQSQPNDRDTDYLCQLGERTPDVAAVIAWVDLESPSATERIAALAARPRLRGVRPMLQDLADDRILEARDEAVRALLAHDLSFDALVRPRHLPHLQIFAKRYPALRIVIDHAAKPDIEHQVLDPWREHLRALARLPNVCCKVSGLVTEAGAAWQAADLAPYVAHLVECFGAQRLMWGSDWPVVEMAGGYARWVRAAQSLTSHLSASEVSAIFHDTAARFYRLDQVTQPLPSYSRFAAVSAATSRPK